MRDQTSLLNKSGEHLATIGFNEVYGLWQIVVVQSEGMEFFCPTRMPEPEGEFPGVARATCGTLRNPNCLGEVRTMHPVGKTRRWSRVTIAAIATLLLGAMFAQNHVDAAEGSLVLPNPVVDSP